MFSVTAVAVSLILMSNSSCGEKKKSNTGNIPNDSITHQRDSVIVDSLATKAMEKNGFLKATVVDKTGLDGCRFMLQLEDGKMLQPLNLGEKYMKDGMKVWVQYTIQKDVMTVCMAGDVVNITEIEKR